MSNAPIEIERKFLISMPDTNKFLAISGANKKEILQTYLLSYKGETARVRKITDEKITYYVKTVKNRISDLSHFEDEYEISKEEYENELKNRDPAKVDIEKTRYCIPFKNHILEIDVYPFWNDRAILEIELKQESESIEIPDFISVIKEVTSDKRYKNTNLAFEIPVDNI